MPRYLDINKKPAKKVRFTKVWYVIPVKPEEGGTALNSESYLIPPRVADYIEKLEKKIKGDLPKLPIKH